MNKFEIDIQEKLKNREIQPSLSAWERLSYQLDIQDAKKRKSWFLYVGYAASIVLIVSSFFFFNNSELEQNKILDTIIVNKDVTIPEIDRNQLEQTKQVDNAIVENEIKEEKNETKKGTFQKSIKLLNREPVIAQKVQEKKGYQTDKKITVDKVIQKQESVIAKIDAEQTKYSKEEFIIPKTNSAISVNSEALLYAVTHTKEELRSYYQKYQISQAEILKTIKRELKKSNFKIDASTILAEVERDVTEEIFQNNFYQFIKKRVSDVATAIANRNN